MILRKLPTKSTHVKHLLRVLDDHAGDRCDCWLTLETIAKEMVVGVRTVIRAVAEAEKEGWLITIPPEDTGRPCNTYRLRRAEMRDAIRRVEWEEDFGIRDEAGSANQTPGVCQLDTQAVTNRHPEGVQLAHEAYHEAMVENTIEAMGQNGVFKDGTGWGCKITAEMLGSISGVHQLFQAALTRGWVKQIDRLRFFTAARSVRRRAGDGEIDNPGGAFTRIVKRRLWGNASQADEDAATKALKQLDRELLFPAAAAEVNP